MSQAGPLTPAGGRPQAANAVERLRDFYGLPALPHDNLFAAFVWEVLGMRTAPLRREAAWHALLRIPALTPDAVRRAPRAKLEAALRLAGPHLDERLHVLKQGVEVFRRWPVLSHEASASPRAIRQALGHLPDLGDGALRRIVCFGTDWRVVPRDAGVIRVWTRLAGAPGTGRRVEAYPADVTGRRQAVALLTHHAAATCLEADPKCGVCPLSEVCAAPPRRPR